MSKGSIKILPPRPLTSTETTHSLSQWKVNFKQYCKKDESFKHFLLSTTRWDFTKDMAGFTANVGTRTPAVLKEDLEDFSVEINILADCVHPNVVGLYEAFFFDGKLWVRAL